MAITPIKYYGKFTPTGVDTSAGDKYKALAGLSNEVGNIAFKVGEKIRTDQGRQAGLEAGVTAAKEGTPIESKDGLLSQFSIFDQSYNDSMKTAYVAQLSTDTAIELDRLSTEYADDINGFNNTAPAYVDQTLASVSPEFEPIVRSSLIARLNRDQNKIAAATKEKNEAIALDQMVAGVNRLEEDTAQLAYDGNLRDTAIGTLEYIGALETMVSNGQMSEVQFEENKTKFKTRLRRQEIIGNIDRTIFDKKLPLKDRLIAGEAFLNQVRKQEFEDLSPEDKSSLLSVVEGKVSDVRTAYNQEQSIVSIEEATRVSNLQINAKNGLLPAEEIFRETEELFNLGAISGAQRTSIINNVYTRQEKIKGDSEAVNKVQLKFGGQDVNLTQSDVNTYYDAIKDDMGTGIARVETQANLIEVLRIIPKGLSQEVNIALQSGDPERIALAAILMDKANQFPGMADQLVTTNQYAFATNMATLMQTMTPEQAVDLANKNTDPNDLARVERVTKQIKDEEYIDNYPSWTEDAIGDAPYRQMDKAVNQYKTLFETMLKSGADETAAKNYADGIMQANWREDPQFGFMQYPPSEFYSVDGDSEFVRIQLYDYVIDNFASGYIPNMDDIFIESDGYTARTAATGKPYYKVIVRNENGVFEHDSDYWAPDMEGEIALQEKLSEAEIMERRSFKGRGNPDVYRAFLGAPPIPEPTNNSGTSL
tara:strand:- start:5916 stop:8039 length:2124 start_codon:yes stop_codon:yes gene_type:complete